MRSLSLDMELPGPAGIVQVQADGPVLQASRHFLSNFDMVAIGIALICVMLVLGVRRILGRGR